jgi:hypothetical protein
VIGTSENDNLRRYSHRSYHLISRRPRRRLAAAAHGHYSIMAAVPGRRLAAAAHGHYSNTAAAPNQPTKQARLLPLCRRFRVAELVEALGRPALHAKSLGFTHPITGERLQFTSDLPPDFQVLHKVSQTLDAGLTSSAACIHVCSCALLDRVKMRSHQAQHCACGC